MIHEPRFNRVAYWSLAVHLRFDILDLRRMYAAALHYSIY